MWGELSCLRLPLKGVRDVSLEWIKAENPVPYEDAVKEMNHHIDNIINHKADERVWLLEHPPVYTLGTSAKKRDVLQSDRCDVIETGRGGQVTFHGPGQRVVYLMLDLNKRTPDLRKYVQTLENWIIATLADFGIDAEQRQGRVGLWVRDEKTRRENKIAAIGVRVKKWVTMHGLALNVSPDLSYYDGIVPCGITEHGVTSMHQLGVSASMEEVDVVLKRQFSNFFV
jgi:lipoyl(octanoyl) transferase